MGVRVRMLDNRDEAADCIVGSPRLQAVTRALLGAGFSVKPAGMFMATRRGCGQGWHQDTGSLAPGQFILNRLVYS